MLHSRYLQVDELMPVHTYMVDTGTVIHIIMLLHYLYLSVASVALYNIYRQCILRIGRASYRVIEGNSKEDRKRDRERETGGCITSATCLSRSLLFPPYKWNHQGSLPPFSPTSCSLCSPKRRCTVTYCILYIVHVIS